MTARLGAIMVTAEAADVVGASIGNRRSALDAKGGSRSGRAITSLYRTDGVLRSVSIGPSRWWKKVVATGPEVRSGQGLGRGRMRNPDQSRQLGDLADRCRTGLLSGGRGGPHLVGRAADLR